MKTKLCRHNPNEPLLWPCKSTVFTKQLLQSTEMKMDNTLSTVHVKMSAVATYLKQCVVKIKWSTGDHQHEGKYKNDRISDKKCR